MSEIPAGKGGIGLTIGEMANSYTEIGTEPEPGANDAE
jgi:hypothetical protein